MQSKRIGKTKLVEFLEMIDEELEKPIDLIAVGGTALTLLGLKTSTIDVDFNFKDNQDEQEFKKASDRIPHGWKIDYFVGGFIFFTQLPDDYLQKCIRIHKFRHIRLYTLHPLDIIVSKIGRLDERDIEDIKSCIKKYKLEKNQVKKRAEKVVYTGNERNYEANLQYVLENLF
ncbi:MAG: DUF6036 family nucleotidyltransferase [Candidatus Micrarchaeia archaeon]